MLAHPFVEQCAYSRRLRRAPGVDGYPPECELEGVSVLGEAPVSADDLPPFAYSAHQRDAIDARAIEFAVLLAEAAQHAEELGSVAPIASAVVAGE